MVSVLANSSVSPARPGADNAGRMSERQRGASRPADSRNGASPPPDRVSLSPRALGQNLSLSLFSFRESFASVAQVQAESGNGRQFTSMLDSLDGQLQEIAGMSPEVGEALSILAGVLKTLNPEAAERMLESISETFGRVRQMMGAPEGAPAADAPPPPSADAGGVSFSLDITIESSVSVKAAVARMRENGFTVETAEIEASQRIQIHIEFGVQQNTKKSDPIVLDLSGDGVDLSGIEDGKNFDIDADGKTDRTGFVRGDDAFLAMDHNGNGAIDDGSELFGDQHGAKNGFEELAKYDENGDRRIDANDSVYDDLRLLFDVDGDGKVRNDETRSLAEEGIESINLDYDADWKQDDKNGNTLAQRSAYTRADGTTGQALDAWIAYRSA